MSADPVLAERDDTIRNEGNAAHWLASVVFNGTHTVEEMIDRKAPNGVLITMDIAEHVADYLEELQLSPDGAEWRGMEHVTSFSGAAWNVNARADHIAIWNGNLYIDDFKYGYSIVSPEMNWTLIAHAIGFCLQNNFAPDTITFAIHQPRAPHRDGRTRSHKITYAELFEFYSELTAKLTFPSDTLQTGSHCYKCPSFASCPARQDAELNAIEAAHVAFNAHIDNIELAARMDQIARAMDLLKQSKEAYEEAAKYRIKSGQILDNYTVEDELTNRVWKDGVTPEIMGALTGKILTKQTLLSPRQAEQAGVNPIVVASLTERRSKGVKLVRVNANKKAERLFGSK